MEPDALKKDYREHPDGRKRTFSQEFWNCVSVLSTTLKQNSPLVGSRQLSELVADFQQASPDTQEAMKHDLGILIARLIQIDRMLHEHLRQTVH